MSTELAFLIKDVDVFDADIFDACRPTVGIIAAIDKSDYNLCGLIEDITNIFNHEYLLDRYLLPDKVVVVNGVELINHTLVGVLYISGYRGTDITRPARLLLESSNWSGAIATPTAVSNFIMTNTNKGEIDPTGDWKGLFNITN